MKGIVLSLVVFLFAGIAAAQPPAKVVVANVVEKEIAKTNQMVGILDFDQRSGISPEISGLIETIAFDEGDTVKKGDLLVRLNTDFIKKNIEIRRKEAEQVQITIENTQKNLARFELLYKTEAATEKAYEDLADKLRELQARHDMVNLEIDRLKLELEKSTIRAPFDGIILRQDKNGGEWVAPGMPICLLGSTGDIVVKVAVSEDLIRYIRPGSEVFLSIDALGKELSGKIEQIVPLADLATKTFQVKVAIPYFESAIQNMSVTINVPVSHKMMLKMIKRDALIRNQGKEFVYTVKDGKAAILPVNIVVYAGEFIGVDNPYIVPGMPVVVDGNDRLRPDQAVEIIKK